MRFLDDLHAMLSTSQRKRVVALAYGEEEPDEENLTEQERLQRDQAGLMDRLGLSTGQKARLIAPLLAVYFRYMGPIGELRRSMREAKDAFISPEFRSKDLTFFSEVDWRPLGQAIFEAGEVLLGVLEPHQRETLARYIETRWS
jgi:hypothetical protein